jgi:hypothetical protein
MLAMLALLLAPQLDLFDESALVPLDSFAPGSAALVGRPVVGDVTGDHLPDVLFLRDGKPYLVYGPAAYRSGFSVDEPALELALLAGLAPGKPHELALLTTLGVRHLGGYDAGAFTGVLLADGPWAGAAHLRVGDFDGDGLEDLLALSSANEVLRLEDLRSAAHTIVLAQPQPVYDLAALDWDGVAPDEVAVLRADGFFVLDAAGTVVHGVALPVAGGILAPFREPDAPGERCAILGALGANQLLAVVDAAGTLESLDLGPGSAWFALAAADADLDGYDDLHLAVTSSASTLLLRNRAEAPTFALTPADAELVDLAPGQPVTSWSAAPLFADLSLDGDPDLLAFLAPLGELRTLENARWPAGRTEVDVLSGTYVYDQGADLGELFLRVRVPDTLAFAPTHVQALLWREPPVPGGSVEPVPAALGLFRIDANAEARVDLVFAEADLSTTNHYHMDVRAVRAEGPADEVVASATPAVHTFTTPKFLTDALEEDFGPGIPLRTFLIGSPNGSKPTVKLYLDGPELAERQLAPKEVKTLLIPKSLVPPDPF